MTQNEKSTPTASGAAAAPNATVTDIRPIENNAIVYEPLAPKTASGPLQAQLSIDLVIKNNGASKIDIEKVRLSYSGGPALASVTLTDGLRRGEGNAAVDVSTDPSIDPGESCKLMLTPDQKLPIPAPANITIQVHFKNFATPLSLTRALAAHRNPTSTGSYRFPAKAADLAPGEFWSGSSSGAGSHHRSSSSQFYGHDMGVVKWDSGRNEWIGQHGASKTNNTDFLVWNQPIYAMADGIVVDFSEDHDDNVPGTKGTTANSFTIQHGDEIAWYGHLKKGTVNTDLMVKGKTVVAGQFLGKGGNSGSSTSPHLHVHVKKDGIARPLLFQDMFVIERASLHEPYDKADWTPVVRQGLPWEKTAIWPSPFFRRDTVSGGPASEVAIARARSNLAVTAARDAGGNLKLQTWEVSSKGELTNKGDASAGAISEVALGQPGFSSDVVTAVRDGSGNLKLIAWDILPTGGIVRQGDASAGTASKIAMTRTPDFGIGVITALRDGSGDLKLIAWERTATGQFIRKDDAVGGPVSQVAITAIHDPFPGVVAAYRDAAGDLGIKVFQVKQGLQLVTRGTAGAGAISLVAATTVQVSASKQYIVTAVRDSGGELKLITWDVSAAGQPVRRGDATAGAISEVVIAVDGNSSVVTAVRDSGGNLKLIAWEVTASGDVIRRGDAQAGDASQIALSPTFTSSGRKFMVPALRGGDGYLRVITWQINLTP